MKTKKINPNRFTAKEKREIAAYLKTHPQFQVVQFSKSLGGGWSIRMARGVDGVKTVFGFIHPRSFLEMFVREKKGKFSLKPAPSIDTIVERAGKKLLDLERQKLLS